MSNKVSGPSGNATASLIYRMEQLPALLGVSRTNLYAEIAVGRFPKPVRLPGNRAVGWKAADVQAWIDQLEVKA